MVDGAGAISRLALRQGWRPVRGDRLGGAEGRSRPRKGPPGAWRALSRPGTIGVTAIADDTDAAYSLFDQVRAALLTAAAAAAIL